MTPPFTEAQKVVTLHPANFWQVPKLKRVAIKCFCADSAPNATILNGFCKRLTPLLPSAGRQFAQENIHLVDDAVNLNYGPDKITPKILKLSAPCLAIHLTKLLYLCISNSTWPAECKLSHVTPVFKKDDATSVSNYIPAIQQIPSYIQFSHQTCQEKILPWQTALCQFRFKKDMVSHKTDYLQKGTWATFQ